MLRGLLAILALFFSFTFSKPVNAVEFNLFCNTCTSSSEFLSVVDKNTPPTGSHEVLIFNLATSTVKAYRVEFLDSGGGKFGGQKIISLVNTPAKAYRALQLYNELAEGTNLKSSSAIQTSKNNSLLGEKLSNQSVENGCGSPGSSSYPYIPDTPFEESCNNHDICYTTSASKHQCDTQFLTDMLNQVDYIVSSSDITDAMLKFNLTEALSKAIIREFLIGMAGVYHYAVVNAPEALAAYCQNTTVFNAPECAELDNGSGGTHVGNETMETPQRPGGGSIAGKCELWEFPDGNGGSYFMLRNCQYASTI